MIVCHHRPMSYSQTVELLLFTLHFRVSLGVPLVYIILVIPHTLPQTRTCFKQNKYWAMSYH